MRELRRIFDNLSSNVHKYADPDQSVYLDIRLDKEGLCIQQTNRILPEPGEKDSYKLGIHSIRRIVQNYGGKVSVWQDAESVSITSILSEF